MKVRRIFVPAVCVLIAIFIFTSGCICFNSGNTGPSPTPATTPTAMATGTPTHMPTSTPSGTIAPTAIPSPGQPQVMSAELSGWSMDKDTYARGDTAKGGVDVKNTGNAIIDQMGFKVVITRMIFNVPYSKEFSYSATGLNIMPGETKRVEFSQEIPAEYSGVSTVGDYTLDVTATLDGKTVGNFSKKMKIV